MMFRSSGSTKQKAAVRAAAACFALGLLGCGGGPSREVVGGPNQKGIPFEDLTLQNAFSHVGSGPEYIEGTGSGRPPEDEKNMGARRKVSMDAAIVEAEKQLIAKLQRLVKRDKIRDLLKKAQVGKLEYTYDDGCVVTLRIPKEAVVGTKPIEEDSWGK